MINLSLAKLWFSRLLLDRRVACVLLVAATMVAGAVTCGAALAAEDFPFGHVFVLEAEPVAGAAHAPSLDIDAKGSAKIKLWCNDVDGQLYVKDEQITIMTSDETERSCSHELAAADEDMLARFSGVVVWRREGDMLLLSGAGTLRFRLKTN
jgi:heat shock protein HslJ